MFWYRRADEVRVLYEDYCVLVESTGFTPPLHVVEDIIVEIAKRITEREAELVTRVQSRWRGVVVQSLFWGVFLREVVRVREIMMAEVFKIQRVYRGWLLGRRFCRRVFLERDCGMGLWGFGWGGLTC